MRCTLVVTGICRPYLLRPQRLAKLAADEEVFGVAYLNEKIYAVCEWSPIIRVYDAKAPYLRQPNIEVEDLQRPRDIAACDKTKRLFVTDFINDCVWEVDVSVIHVGEKVKSANKLIEGVSLESLSLSADRLLLTPYEGNELMLYTVEGIHITSLKLPVNITPRHAVETPTGNFILSHFGVGANRSDGVIEIDKNGNEVAAYDDKGVTGALQLDWPHHVSVDKEGRIFVADHNNKRVLLLNSKLQLERVLMNADCDTLGEPRRLTFVEEMGLLLICEWEQVRVYKMRND